MEAHAERRFNLVDEDWIPVAGAGKVSLLQVFTDANLTALGGNPVEKIALTKLFLAIAQGAHTPENEEKWLQLGALGLAEKAKNYLTNKKDLFWLYGNRPFLQFPAIVRAKTQSLSAVLPSVATGNTTVLIESQIERELEDAEKALVLVFLAGFSLGGKKTDNSISLSSGYTGKMNEKGKPSTGKPGPSMGYLGYLHSFLCGASLQETIWLNLITQEQIQKLKQFPKGIGVPPWEQMPDGEDCGVAKGLKECLMGRLVPLCRFALLNAKGIHYSEGILHPTHKEGGFDPSVTVNFAKEPKALWVDPERRPWRQLTSLLSFLNTEGNQGFDCVQLRTGVLRARKAVPEFTIWSGGLRVSSNAGEQYVAGSDDYLESEVRLSTEWLEKGVWFTYLQLEMTKLEGIAKAIYGATIGYFKKMHTDGKNQAGMVTNLYWQLSERSFQNMVNACDDKTGKEILRVRRVFIDYANQAFNTFCPRQTTRQMDAWAASRPNLGRFLISE